MKNDTKNDIRNMSDKELEKRFMDISSELVNFRMELMIGKQKNVHAGKVLKKERAFIKTIMSERKMTEETEVVEKQPAKKAKEQKTDTVEKKKKKTEKKDSAKQNKKDKKESKK